MVKLAVNVHCRFLSNLIVKFNEIVHTGNKNDPIVSKRGMYNTISLNCNTKLLQDLQFTFTKLIT